MHEHSDSPVSNKLRTPKIGRRSPLETDSARTSFPRDERRRCGGRRGHGYCVHQGRLQGNAVTVSDHETTTGAPG